MILLFVLYFLLMYSVFLKSPLIIAYPHPFFFTALQCSSAGFFLLALYVLYRREWTFYKLSFKQYVHSAIVGMLLYGIPLSAFAFSMQYIDKVAVCFMLAAKPFLNIILVFFKERKLITLQQFVGLCIGLAGLIPIILHMKPASHDVPQYLVYVGLGVFFIATIVYSYAWILFKDLIKEMHDFSVKKITGLNLLFGGAFAYTLHLLVEQNVYPPTITPDFMWGVINVGFWSALTYWLYSYLLHWYSTTLLSFATFLQPGFGLLFAYFVYGEQFDALLYICLGLLVVGLYIFYRDELQVLK
ncbi:DMT family transporter [bacterium]|nr:DMT family transporter [bacterium]NBX78424.1 DMT family transporter [bacterium]